jgi:CRISPR/Cas system CMR-associated protein Cmr1 (group 7 of RAMP superfamily)
MEDIDIIMNIKTDFEDIKSGKKKLSKKLLKKYKKYIPDEVEQYIKNLPKEGIDLNIP